jgi:hypothetical protein
MRTVQIIIPVYKERLSAAERSSLVQCLKVLNSYGVSIVTHSEISIRTYIEIAKENDKTIEIEYFDKQFFDSIGAYSRMLYSRGFYERFSRYEYIFIYQLDGYVFRDELAAWCTKGYDYIGAPWLVHYGRGKYKNSKTLYKVGNGGVSVRRVSAFIERFERKMPLSVFPFYVRNIRKRRMIPMLIKTMKLLVSILVFSRDIEYCLRQCTEDLIPEDCFWADALSRTSLALNIPDVMTGARFAFEKAPSYLYELIGGRLPFACHAYEKYEYETFWRGHIENKQIKE